MITEVEQASEATEIGIDVAASLWMANESIQSNPLNFNDENHVSHFIFAASLNFVFFTERQSKFCFSDHLDHLPRC